MCEQLEGVAADLEAQLALELRNRDLRKAQTDAIEVDVRQAKEQLSEMARAANEYDALIPKNEHDITHQTEELNTPERNVTLKRIIQLQNQTESTSAQLTEQKLGNSQGKVAQMKLQKEVDESRTLAQSKASEET
jgi:hypothetical protein